MSTTETATREHDAHWCGRNDGPGCPDETACPYIATSEHFGVSTEDGDHSVCGEEIEEQWVSGPVTDRRNGMTVLVCPKGDGWRGVRVGRVEDGEWVFE